MEEVQRSVPSHVPVSAGLEGLMRNVGCASCGVKTETFLNVLTDQQETVVPVRSHSSEDWLRVCREANTATFWPV